MASNKSDIDKKKMLECLERHFGLVYYAVQEANIARSTHYEWLKHDPAYKAAVDEISEYCLDFAESSLMKLIKKGDTAATIFFNKTRGKQRGYIERQEFDVMNDKLTVNFVTTPPAATVEDNGEDG